MSVYSTPIKTSFDEGSSPCSNQSFYFTPRETFTYYTPQSKSRRRKTRYDGRIPKFSVYDELSRSEENLKNDSIVSSPISVKDYVSWGRRNSQGVAKEALISVGKENIGVQFNSSPSLIRCEKKANFTPLKNISNAVTNEKASTVFEARICTIGKQQFDLRIITQTDVEEFNERNKVRCNTKVQNDENTVSSIKDKDLSRQSRNNSNKLNGTFDTEKSKIMLDIPTQTEADISFDYVCKEGIENEDVPKTNKDEGLKNESLDENKISVETDNLGAPLLVVKRTPERKLKIWPFQKITRLRISPVKRLFTKSSKYLLLLKQKLGNLSIRSFKPLPYTKIDAECCTSTEVNVRQTQQTVCTLCLGKLTDKEEMMSKALSTLMMKLSSMEDELKEIKGLLKNNAVDNLNPIRSIQLPPPPPPPPPPPSNFLNSTGTLKRKADLTTPESDNHAVKRPAIKNEKTHFAITVEDIRSVKLRKTPANAFRRESKTNATGDDALRSIKMKKNKKNNSGGKKRTQTLADICSRENVTINRDSIYDSNVLCTPRRENLLTPMIYEETPVTTKSALLSNRSQKRKELLIESPVRKRINTGNNSTIYSDKEPEY